MSTRLIAIVVSLVLSPKLFAASFQSLGGVAFGSFLSAANAVSADGKVVVGQFHSTSGYEAFRWTAATGLVGLRDLPGGSFYSEASAVSADGSVIAGSSSSAA